MPEEQETLTISEAAQLVERHPNTIRQRIKSGQLEAHVEAGRFGDEYRISRQALRDSGLLRGAFPASDQPEPRPAAPAEDENETPDAAAGVTTAALIDLYQRHEQAMFRLGYMQGEMERNRALAETAESLRADRDTGELALREARAEAERLRALADQIPALHEAHRESELARARLEAAAEARGLELTEARDQLRLMRGEMGGLRARADEGDLRVDECRRQAKEIDELKARLAQADAELSILRKENAELKDRLAEREQELSDAAGRPWWRPYRKS